jgi:hypothetical protein
MARVLICHVPHDAPTARELGAALMGLGHTISFDGQPDAAREDRFPRLRHFDTVAIVWTEGSVASAGLTGLAREALALNILAPLAVENLDVQRLPIGFRKLNVFRIRDTESISRSIQRLATAKSLRREVKTTPIPDPPRRQSFMPASKIVTPQPPPQRPLVSPSMSLGVPREPISSTSPALRPTTPPRPPPEPPSPTFAVDSSAPAEVALNTVRLVAPPPAVDASASPVLGPVRLVPPPPLEDDPDPASVSKVSADPPPPPPPNEAEVADPGPVMDGVSNDRVAPPKVRRLASVAGLLPDVGDDSDMPEVDGPAVAAPEPSAFERLVAEGTAAGTSGSAAPFVHPPALVAAASARRARSSFESLQDEALAVKAEQLLYLIPGEMWLGEAENVVVRLGSAAMIDLVQSASSPGTDLAGDLPEVVTMSISLHSADGTFEIERVSETTQRVGSQDASDGLLDVGTAGYWEWLVTPQTVGEHMLFVRISAFLKDRRGVPYSAALDDQSFPIFADEAQRPLPGWGKIKTLVQGWRARD